MIIETTDCLNCKFSQIYWNEKGETSLKCKLNYFDTTTNFPKEIPKKCKIFNDKITVVSTKNKNRIINKHNKELDKLLSDAFIAGSNATNISDNAEFNNWKEKNEIKINNLKNCF